MDYILKVKTNDFENILIRHELDLIPISNNQVHSTRKGYISQ